MAFWHSKEKRIKKKEERVEKREAKKEVRTEKKEVRQEKRTVKKEVRKEKKSKKKEFGTGPTKEFTPLEKVISTITYGKEKGEGLTSEEKKEVSKKRGIKFGTMAAASILTGALIGGVAGAVTSKVGQAAKLSTKFPGLGISISQNAKNVGLTSKIFAKAGMTTAGAMLAVGAVGTYPFAKFELAETMDKLGIAMFSAQQAGDEDMVIEVSNLIDEMANPSTWDKILSIIPYVNVWNAAKKNTAAAVTSAGIFKYLAEQEKIRQETNETTEDMWVRIYAERDTRLEQKRIDDEEYYKTVDENKAKAKAEERTADEKYWNKIFADRDKKKAEDRLAEEEYWAEILKKRQEIWEANRPSNLNFGLL